jgi:Na+/proline symporter
MNGILAGILVYVAVQLLLGIAVSRRIRSEEDYLLAGRRLGYGLATFSMFATWFGAESCIGAAGATYANGLSGGRADPFGYALCLFLMGFLLAGPLFRRKLTTLGDLFRERYSASVERLAVLLMIPASLLWGAAQIRAFGQILSASSGLELGVAMTLAAGVAVLYTGLGGLLADAMTDLLQGISILAGLVVLFSAVWVASGGQAWSAVEPTRLQWLAGGEEGWLGTLEAWATPVLGSVVAQELVSRVSASRSAPVASRSAILAGTLYGVVGLMPLGLGLLGPALVPGLEDPEQILPHLARRYLPTVGYVLFAGSLVSAILSTVDSTLLAASSLASRNLIQSLWPGLGEARKVQLARAGVFVAGALAYGLALSGESVFGLVEEASAFGGAGFVVLLLFGLFSRFGGAPSGMVALVGGAAVQISGTYLVPFEFPFLASLLVAAAAYTVVGIWERARRRAGWTFPVPGGVSRTLSRQRG